MSGSDETEPHARALTTIIVVVAVGGKRRVTGTTSIPVSLLQKDAFPTTHTDRDWSIMKTRKRCRKCKLIF
jgi:hypothetical protein